MLKNLPFFKRMDTVENPTVNINSLNTEPISKQGKLPKTPTEQLSKIDVDKIFTLKNVGKFLKLSKEDSIKETTKGIGKSLLDKYSNILGEKLENTELPGIETLGKRLITNSNQVEEAVETQEEAVETQEEAVGIQEELVKQGKLPPKPPPGSPAKSTDRVDKVVVEEFKPEKIDIEKDQLQLSSEHLLDSSEKLRVTSENLKEIGTAKPKVGDIDVAATEREKELESRINFDNLSDNIQINQERETDRLIDSFEDLSSTVEKTGGSQSAILAGLAAFFTGGAGLAAMLSTSVGGILAGGIGGILGSAGLLAAAGAAGYGVGTLINKYFVEPAMQKVYKSQEERVSKASTTAIGEQTSSFAKMHDTSLSSEERAKETRKVQLGAMGGFDKDFGATFDVNNKEIAAHVKKYDAENMELYSQYSVNEVKALRSAFKFPDIGGGEKNEEYAKKYVDAFKKRLIKVGTKLTETQLKEQAVKIEKSDERRSEAKKVEDEKVPSIVVSDTVVPTLTEEGSTTDEIKKVEDTKQGEIKKAEDIDISDFDKAVKDKPVIIVAEKAVSIGGSTSGRVSGGVEKIPSIVAPTKPIRPSGRRRPSGRSMDMEMYLEQELGLDEVESKATVTDNVPKTTRDPYARGGGFRGIDYDIDLDDEPVSTNVIPMIKPQVIDKSDEAIKQIAKKEKSEKIVTERTIETKGKPEVVTQQPPQIVAVPMPAKEEPSVRRTTSVDDAGVELLRTILS